MQLGSWLRKFVTLNVSLLFLLQSGFMPTDATALTNGSSETPYEPNRCNLEARNKVKHPRPAVVTHGNWRLKVALITRSDVIRRPKCHTASVRQCVFNIMYSVILFWTTTYVPQTELTGLPPRKGSRAPSVGKSMTFRVGRGSSNLFETHMRASFDELELPEADFQDMVGILRRHEPHYLFMTNHGNNTFSTGWFVNETSSPGLNSMVEKRKHNFVTSGTWTYYNENPNSKQKFNKSKKHVLNMSVRIAEFLNTHIARAHGVHRGYCMAAHTPLHRCDIDSENINFGAFRFGFNHKLPKRMTRVYNPCRHKNQGVNG